MRMTASPKCAIFLSGPIGVGKTTLGRALARSIGGEFIDGDDHSEAGMPWYCSILRTSRSVVQTTVSLLQSKPIVVIAHPLTCVTWIYYRRRFEDAGIRTLVISLRATFAAIVDEGRGRRFDDAEQKRIRIMIAEGYGERPFSDLIIDTDRGDFTGTLAHLTFETQRLMRHSRPR